MKAVWTPRTGSWGSAHVGAVLFEAAACRGTLDRTGVLPPARPPSFPGAAAPGTYLPLGRDGDVATARMDFRTRFGCPLRQSTTQPEFDATAPPACLICLKARTLIIKCEAVRLQVRAITSDTRLRVLITALSQPRPLATTAVWFRKNLRVRQRGAHTACDAESVLRSTASTRPGRRRDCGPEPLPLLVGEPGGP